MAAINTGGGAKNIEQIGPSIAHLIALQPNVFFGRRLAVFRQNTTSDGIKCL